MLEAIKTRLRRFNSTSSSSSPSSRSRRKSTASSSTMSKRLPWDSTARQVIERMSSQLAAEAEAEEQRQENLSAPMNINYGSSSAHRPIPTIHLEDDYGSTSPLSPGGSSYSSYYPPTTYINSPAFSSYEEPRSAHSSSSYHHPYPYDSVPMTPAYSQSSQYQPPRTAHSSSSYHHPYPYDSVPMTPSYSHSSQYHPHPPSNNHFPSPKLPSIYPPSPSYSSPKIGGFHRNHAGGSSLAKVASYASTELSYDSYEAMDYETVPYTRYSAY